MASVIPSPPFIDIGGIANFRDIGYVGHGDFVRQGLIFRAADPSKATKEGLEKMGKNLGIKVIFDFRSTPEIKRDGPEWAGVEVDKADVFADYGIERKFVPVFASEDYGPEQVALRYKQYTRAGTEGFVKAYTDILKAAGPAYTAVFKHLSQQQPSPCLVHCTAGKDRTGVLVALLFLLAGVPQDEIASEYSLTDQGLASLRPLFIERLLKNPALEGDREGVMNMVSSKPANMIATINMINTEFGGAEKYIRDYCKLSGEEIQTLQKNLLVSRSSGSAAAAPARETKA